MKKYFSQLNLTINPLKEDFDFRRQTVPHEIIGLDNVNPKISDFFERLNIKVSYIECFYRRPFNRGSIHIDNKIGDFVKINWVYGGEGSIMNWYSIKPGYYNKNESILQTKFGGNYQVFSLDEVTLECSSTMEKPTLVQVGEPHTVINFKEHRYCVCFLINDIGSNGGQRLTMSRSLELLKDYVI